MINYKKIYRVKASVYPTPHNKIWLSSGRVPLYVISNTLELINFSDRAKSMKLKKVYKDTNNLIVRRGFSVLLGFISDIIAINRRHPEEILYSVKNGRLGGLG